MTVAVTVAVCGGCGDPLGDSPALVANGRAFCEGCGERVVRALQELERERMVQRAVEALRSLGLAHGETVAKMLERMLERGDSLAKMVENVRDLMLCTMHAWAILDRRAPAGAPAQEGAAVEGEVACEV